MAELKRKDEQLTTADLAARAENKNRPVRDEDLANEKRAVDRATNRANIDRAANERTPEINRATNVDRSALERSAPDRATNEEWGGPTIVRRETPTDLKQNERKLERNPAASTPAANSAPLFSEADVNDLRGRWSHAQSNFVDEPRKAVEEADKLVATVMQRLADGFASERSNLEKQWDKGDNVSTEDLRVALQRYRSFFDRLLAA